MRLLFIQLLLVCCVIFNAEAQNRSIRFEDSDWKTILKKAKKENKMIFVDCYTSWCGPCKQLSKDVFTQDAVADLFNKEFVNFKLDMEKGEGPGLKSFFEIKAYPTLLFLSPDGMVVHRLVGSMPAAELIEEANRAKDPKANFAGMKKRYENNERSPEFIMQYLHTLDVAYISEEKEYVTIKYLEPLTDDELAIPANWALIKDNVGDIMSRPLQVVMKNKDKFYKIAPEAEIDQKIETAFRFKTGSFCRWTPDTKEPFDEKAFYEWIKYCRSINDPLMPVCLANLYTLEYALKGNYAGMLDEMGNVLKYRIFRGYHENSYIVDFLRKLKYCDDKAAVKKGIDWFDLLIAESSGHSKASLMNAEASLYSKIGDVAKAEELKVEAEIISKAATEKIMRMINR